MTREVERFLREKEKEGMFLIDVSKLALRLADLEFKCKYLDNPNHSFKELIDIQKNDEEDPHLKEPYDSIYAQLTKDWLIYIIAEFKQK